MRIKRSLAVLALVAGMSGTMAGPAWAVERDCADFASQAEAQAALESDPTDPEMLDANHDGVACEEYPYGSGGTAGSSAGGQVTTPPAGGVATGDGSSADTDVLPFVVGGLGLAAAGGAAFAARRTARGSA
jgi:Excalibur calcium-binding domain